MDKEKDKPNEQQRFETERDFCRRDEFHLENHKRKVCKQ